MYTDQDRLSDFTFFVDNYRKLYQQYGHCYIAIRHKQILGTFSTPKDALVTLTPEHKLGTFLLQECSDDESSFTTYATSLWAIE